MKKRLVYLFFICFCFFQKGIAQSEKNVTWKGCLEAAKTAHPLAKEALIFEKIADLELEGARLNGRPKMDIQAQAAYQSDVFAFPLPLPGVEIPAVPKDQYQLVADVRKTLWDGGVRNYLASQAQVNLEAQKAENVAQVYGVQEQVSELYFSIILLQQQKLVLESTQNFLVQTKKQAQAAVDNGVALRTSVDQISIKELELDQQIEGLIQQKVGLLAVLKTLTGLEFSAEADFQIPEEQEFNSVGLGRPETAVFEAKKSAVTLAENSVDIQRAPKAEAFLKAGIGRPNPFNFFDTNFSPFAQIGLRAVWTPYDWGKTNRQKQELALQKAQIDQKRSAFEQGILVQTQMDKSEIERAKAALVQDDAIIALQEDIMKRAEAQVQNGVMTRTEYLSQVDLLTKQKIAKVVHTVQVKKANALLVLHQGI